MKLFPEDKVAGIFRGLSGQGFEFHADLVLPYRNVFQSMPMFGQFLLVQLETHDEAVLGRITSLSSDGRLASGSGEDFGLRAVAENRVVPEDLRQQYLKYRVNIRVLGVVRMANGIPVFAASQRRLPHVGSKVAFLSDELLQWAAAGDMTDAADIGFLAFGEFVYGGSDPRLKHLDWMRVLSPAVVPRFPIQNLVSKRSFVFARAGYGKSNLVKLLFSNLYQATPTVEKRGGRRVPVGTIIFDADGEYFWPDDKGRPGLCDVPHLENQIAVFTSREGPSGFYDSFVVSDIKLDIRRLRPSDVIGIALSPEKQGQQNVHKLAQMSAGDWTRMVNEIYANRNSTDLAVVMELLKLKDSQEAEGLAARGNMTTIVNMLHDPGSQMLDILLHALREGKICIVDVSQMRGTPALTLSGLILQRIFDHNQLEFTKKTPATIPTIAVVEEAQSVLSGAGLSGGEGPYIAWVKEGRKYDLGALLITQQPGSISHEILSQGDNWFVFHLLSSGDLSALNKANAHFSQDLLSSLLNEPIEGNGVFWTSTGERKYPLPIRALSFEAMYKCRDPGNDQSAKEIYASRIRREFGERMSRAIAAAGLAPNVPAASEPNSADAGMQDVNQTEQPIDALAVFSNAAINALKNNSQVAQRIQSGGMPWKGVIESLKSALPVELENRDDFAHKLVPQALDTLLGKGRWATEKRPLKSGSGVTTWVVPK
jgi:hypothetical protein